jgi:hypothetical protein
MRLDRHLDQITNDRLNITADVADFGEFRGLDLDERRIGQPGQAARNLGLADTGRTDHQDIFRRNFLTQWLGHLRPSPAIAQGNGDRLLGILLADDMLVEFGNDFLRCHRGHSRASIVKFRLV